VRRRARLGERVPQRLEGGDHLGLGCPAGPDGTRFHGGHARRGDLLLELEDDPLGELLADARDGHEDGLVPVMIASCRSASARADDRQGHLGPTPSRSGVN
jgi:hypothetical protein